MEHRDRTCDDNQTFALMPVKRGTLAVRHCARISRPVRPLRARGIAVLTHSGGSGRSARWALRPIWRRMLADIGSAGANCQDRRKRGPELMRQGTLSQRCYVYRLVPAKAGTLRLEGRLRIPACAGMSGGEVPGTGDTHERTAPQSHRADGLRAVGVAQAHDRGCVRPRARARRARQRQVSLQRPRLSRPQGRQGLPRRRDLAHDRAAASSSSSKPGSKWWSPAASPPIPASRNTRS